MKCLPKHAPTTGFCQEHSQRGPRGGHICGGVRSLVLGKRVQCSSASGYRSTGTPQLCRNDQWVPCPDSSITQRHELMPPTRWRVSRMFAVVSSAASRVGNACSLILCAERPDSVRNRLRHAASWPQSPGAEPNTRRQHPSRVLFPGGGHSRKVGQPHCRLLLLPISADIGRHSVAYVEREQRCGRPPWSGVVRQLFERRIPLERRVILPQSIGALSTIADYPSATNSSNVAREPFIEPWTSSITGDRSTP